MNWTGGQPEGQGGGAASQRLQQPSCQFEKNLTIVTLSGRDFLFPMKFLNSTKLSIPSLSLSNFLKQASTWGEGGAWPILRRKPEPGWGWWNCAQSPSSWQAHPCPCPGRQRLSSPELNLEPCFLGRQGWCHLVDLLVDGVQLGDLRRPLFSSGKVVGLGHQLQHLHVACLESLPKSLASGNESCSKALLYRCWIATRLTTNSHCCIGLLTIPRCQSFVHFFLIFSPQDRRKHLSWWESASSWNCESSPLVGFDQCDPAPSLLSATHPILWLQKNETK